MTIDLEAILDERSAAIVLPTPAERLAYQLRRNQGLTDAEIARIVGCSRETVCRRRARFRAKVKAVRNAEATW